MSEEVYNARRNRMETPCETIVFDMMEDEEAEAERQREWEIEHNQNRLN